MIRLLHHPRYDNFGSTLWAWKREPKSLKYASSKRVPEAKCLQRLYEKLSD
jgi:hypothetical protein